MKLFTGFKHPMDISVTLTTVVSCTCPEGTAVTTQKSTQTTVLSVKIDFTLSHALCVSCPLSQKRKKKIPFHCVSIWDRDFVFVEDSVYFLYGPKPGSEKMKRLSSVKLSSLPLHLQQLFIHDKTHSRFDRLRTSDVWRLFPVMHCSTLGLLAPVAFHI